MSNAVNLSIEKLYLKNLLFFYLIKYKTRFIYLLSIFSMTIRKDNISYFLPSLGLGAISIVVGYPFLYDTIFGYFFCAFR